MAEEQWYDEDGSPMAGRGKYDAGGGFTYSPFYADEAHTVMTGIWEWHNCAEGRRMFDRARANGLFEPDEQFLDRPGSATTDKWRFENTDDPEHLTVDPSIQCGMCGFHGFLRNGRWESV